jgi:hypothetical protein
MRSMQRRCGHGTKCQNRSAQRFSPTPERSANSAATVTERQVRFTEQFFDQLDRLLPGERGADGTPSVTDLLLLDLPRVRDRLAADYEGNTLPTDDPDVRVYVGAGVLVSRFAIFVALEADTVEAFWLSIDLERSDLD